MEQQAGLHDVHLFPFLFPCPCLFQPVEGEAVQPAAVPNEEGGGCIEVVEVEVPGKDQGCHHLENQYGKVALAAEAGGCASCEHGVECGGEQDSPKSVVHAHFAGQQFGYVEECWVGFGPWIKIKIKYYQQPKKKNILHEHTEDTEEMTGKAKRWSSFTAAEMQ
jgi:hypothetical protein